MSIVVFPVERPNATLHVGYGGQCSYVRWCVKFPLLASNVGAVLPGAIFCGFFHLPACCSADVATGATAFVEKRVIIYAVLPMLGAAVVGAKNALYRCCIAYRCDI